MSSSDTTRHQDWGRTQLADGSVVHHPGNSYHLLNAGKPHLTCTTSARGTEAILPIAHIMDRTVDGRQQDREDSPTGWPQRPP